MNQLKWTTFFRRLFSVWHALTMTGLKRLMRLSGGTLLGLTLGIFALSESLRFAQTLIPDIPNLWFQLMAAVFDLLISFFLFVLVPANVPEGATPASLGPLLKKHGTDLFFESLRVIAQIVFFSLALLIPGLIKYLRLSFVPFIVVHDAAYQMGERDALAYSESLVKGITWPWALLNLAMVGVQLAITQLEAYGGETFSTTAVGWRLMMSLLNLGFYLYTTVLAFVIYQERSRSQLEPQS